MTTVTLTSANNNWTAPAWVYSIQVEVWGAGGGGAGSNNNTTGAAGGGGGAYARSNVAVIPGTVYTVVIPTGGAGGGNNAAGTAGGNTNFNNNQIKAVGGNGAGVHAAGNGGLNTSSVGDVTYSGGAGFAPAANTHPGGGGGAAGGNAATGNTATTQSGATGAGGGGNGGNGGNNNTVGNNGITPGGGGGGGGNRTSGTKTGGTGGAGQIVITYTQTAPIVLSASNNIGANGTDATTALMTAPANKTSANNFQAGYISDDTNPLPSFDLATDKYTELEWSIKAVGGVAANNEVYLLRVSANGTPLTTYTVTPQWTIGGGTVAKTGSDSATLSETIALTAALTLTDSATLSETAGWSVTDSATLSETSALTATLAASDSGTLTDTSVVGLAATDSGTLSDASALALPAADSATLTESSLLETGTRIDVTDSATLGESISPAAAMPGTDSATLSESIDLAATLPASDSGTLSESTSLVSGEQVDRSDSATLSETSALTATLATSDSGTLTDMSVVGLAATDSGTLSDASALALPAADSGTLSETSALALTVSATDSGTLTDTSAPTANVASNDNTVQSETSALTVAIPTTDSAALSEAAGSSTATLASTDSATLSEASAASSSGSNHTISVGNGYTDVTPRQIVRTSDNRLWIASWKFDTYPHGGIGGGNYNTQTLMMYRADQVGTPSAFTRMDSAHEPAGVVSWSMAVGAGDIIHVLWTVRATWNNSTTLGTDNYLRYSQFNTATGLWGAVENVETAMGTRESGQGDELCAIAADASGVPHIVYLKDDGTRRRVTYRNRSGGTWSAATTVDDQTLPAGQACWHPGICFDQAARMVVTWIRGSDNVSSWTDTDGRIFIRVYASGAWGTTHDVVGANVWRSIDTGTPLYIDAAGRYHICYINNSKYVQYRFSDDQGATWTANHPGTNYLGDDPAPGPGALGKVRIYTHGLSANNYPVVYWEGDGGSGSWGSVTTYSSAATPNDCSVNVRWCRYYWYYPNTLDVAFWQSNYPTNALYVGTEIAATDFYQTDSATLSESSAVSRPLNVTDSATLSDSSVLDKPVIGTEAFSVTDLGGVAFTITASESAALSDAASLAVALAGNDSATLSEASARTSAVVSSDGATLGESASLVVSGIVLNDVFTLDESASLTAGIAGNDSATLSLEISGLDRVLGASDSAALAEVSDLTTGALLSSVDTLTFSEVSSLAVVVTATEACTLSEARGLTAAIGVSDGATFDETSIDITIGMRIDSADSWTLSEASQSDAVITATDFGAFDEALDVAAAYEASDSWMFGESIELSGDQIVRDVVRLGLYIKREWMNTLYIKQTVKIDLEL